MEWLKTQLAQAKAGESSARRRLLLVAVGLVVALVLLVSGQTEATPKVIHPNASTNSSSQMSGGFVHLSGEVKDPGVYPITSGTRLFEVIALAGGFTKKANQDSVNLARVLVDGEQVIVSAGSGRIANDGLVHLNQATEAELDKLPGLGPTLAARIIDWREANHGFQSIDDLRKVGGIGDKLFAGIRKLVSL